MSVIAHVQALDEHPNELLWALHHWSGLLSAPEDFHCNKPAVGSGTNRESAKFALLVPGTVYSFVIEENPKQSNSK